MTESDPGLTRASFLRGAAAAVCLGTSALAPAAPSTLPRIQQRRIPSTGALLPVMGVGTWKTFDVVGDAKEQAERAAVLQDLFQAGGTVIDSSPMYGSSEQVVGDALASFNGRPQAFIATKVWTSGREQGIAQMEESMRRLRTDHVDLMQVHNLVDWRTQLATLREWKRQGRIGHIGFTHYTSSAYPELEAALKAEKVDFVQLNYAVNDREAEKRLLPLAAERGIAVIVNQPFGGGSLLRSLLDKPLPGWAGDIACTSWAQVLLKFVLANPAVTCVIPGTSSTKHLRDNLHAGVGLYPDEALRRRMIEAIG